MVELAGQATGRELVTTSSEVDTQPHVDSTLEASGSLTPEIVIALCGPIGSPLHQAADQIANALNEYEYRTEKLRLSDLIRLNASEVGMTIQESPRVDEIDSLISVGDALRQKFGNDILAKLAIAKISGDRAKAYGQFNDRAAEAETPPNERIVGHRICHVIDSIKNSAELDLLRLIYGDALFAVGVFSQLEIRRKNLERPDALSSDDVNRLIDKDSGEEFSHGQSVRDTFPHCDFFLRVDHTIVEPSEAKAVAQLVEKLRRFFGLLFKTSVVTPTQEEAAMYAAASAARNSACMSRQVGAAVTSSSGEVLAVGWNDVPRSGGGLYGKPPISSFQMSRNAPGNEDHRCFAKAGQKCHNDEEKNNIASKIVDVLVSKNLVSESARLSAISAIVTDSRIRDLIEFSRAVHAEMHAILGAGRVAGDLIVAGKLYVTTYPCHSCARHIVAAGISEIHYIEPYRKSLATRLHEDALTESINPDGKVAILQFDGVAPRRFIEIFNAGTRKLNGTLNLPARRHAIPSTRVSLRAIPRLEEVVVAEIESKQLRFPGLVAKEKNYGQGTETESAA